MCVVFIVILPVILFSFFAFMCTTRVLLRWFCGADVVLPFPSPRDQSCALSFAARWVHGIARVKYGRILACA